MALTTYPASIFVAPGQEQGVLSRVAEEIRSKVTDASVKVETDHAIITRAGGIFVLQLNEYPGIEEENAEIAEAFAKTHPDLQAISRSKLRIEMHLDGDDANMDYFNDGLIYREIAAQAAPGWCFDPVMGTID